MRSGVDQLPADGEADRARGPGDQRHLPGERRLLRPSELRLLEAPVLHVEEVRVAERGVAADRVGERLGAERVLGDVGRDARFLLGAPGGEHADTGHEDDAREGIELRDPGARALAVGLEVGVVRGAIGGHGGVEALAQRLRIVERQIAGQEERRPLGADHVIGGERVRGGDARRIGPGKDVERLLARAMLEDHAAPRAVRVARRLGERAAQHGGEPGRGLGRRHLRPGAPAGRRARARPGAHEALGTVDAGDHPLVSRARVVGEGEQAVVHEHQPLGRRVALVDLGRQLGEREAGHDVRHDRPARAEGLAHHRLHRVARLVGHHQRDVGVRVVDEAMRQEGVEQRLDRGIRRARVEEVRAELVHHFLVRQLAERAQLAQVRQVHRREAGRLDRVEVPAAALDEQRLHPLADQRRHRPLERGVAAAVQHEIGIAADQPRGVDAQRQVLAPARREARDELGGFAVRPAALHERATLGGRTEPFQAAGTGAGPC